MKISRVKNPEYVLELTYDELVALGILGYRHEDVRGVRQGFYRSLPSEIRVAVEKLAPRNGDKTTPLGIEWEI